MPYNSVKHRAQVIYRTFFRRCGKRPAYRDVEVRMTKEEWLEWAIPRYEECLAKYPGETLSVSRFNDKGHYEIGNIEIIPERQNRALQRPKSRVVDGHKRCGHCNVDKPVSEYKPCSKGFDGLKAWCIPCRREYDRAYNKRRPDRWRGYGRT